MFNSIRRHQKWLWILISGLTIISFVAFFSPRVSRQRGKRFVGGVEMVGSIDGRSISRDEYVDAYREAQLYYLFNAQRWPGNEANEAMEQITRERLLRLEKVKQFDIRVSQPAVAQWIVDAFKDRQTQQFRKEAFDQFVTEALPRQGLRRRDLERFAEHEVGIQHLAAVVGVAGKLIAPQEAEIRYRRANEQADTQVVLLSLTNYLERVQMDPVALATFYTNQLSNYRIPDRVQVAYVQFDATNYLAEADQAMALNTNLNRIVEQTYQQRGTNYYRDTNNVALSPEAAKEKVRSEVRQQYELKEAQKKAVDFASALLELPPNTNNLVNLAAAKGLVSHVADPFSREEQPPGLNVPESFARTAFRLTPEQPFSEDPIVGEEAVFVIGLHRRLPSEPKPFEQVREKVIEDYKRVKATETIRAEGNQLYTTITNNLAQGKEFLSSAQSTNVTVLDLPPFSASTATLSELQNRSDFSSIKTTAFALTTGKTSAFTPTRDGGFIVYLQTKVPVAEDKLKSELPKYLDNLRRSAQYEAFLIWLRKEAELAHISLPGNKQMTE